MHERSGGGGAVTLEKLEQRFDDELAVDGMDLRTDERLRADRRREGLGHPARGAPPAEAIQVLTG